MPILCVTDPFSDSGFCPEVHPLLPSLDVVVYMVHNLCLSCSVSIKTIMRSELFPLLVSPKIDVPLPRAKLKCYLTCNNKMTLNVLESVHVIVLG